MEYIITCLDEELRKAPVDGRRLGKLRLGETVQSGTGWKNGWVQLVASTRGAGWYPAAYMQEVAVEEPSNNEEPPVVDDPITGLTVTVMYESGRVEIERYILA